MCDMHAAFSSKCLPSCMPFDTWTLKEPSFLMPDCIMYKGG